MKALLVAINDYGIISDLRGCINDVTNIRHVLMRYFGCSADDISMLVDRSVTKARLKQRIAWLFEGATQGDCLLFHFSGHGSYIRDFDGDEAERNLRDQVDELICLYGMDWRDRSTYLIDDEIGSELAKCPDGVSLTVILDCCHSGTGTRGGIQPPPGMGSGASGLGHPGGHSTNVAARYGGFDFGGSGDGGSGGGFDWGNVSSRGVSGETPMGAESVSRFLMPPIDIQARIDERAIMPLHRLLRGNEDFHSNHVLFAGCRDDQTSADALIGGGYNGAFTYYLCKTLREAGGRVSNQGLIEQVRHSLRYNRFAQVPQLECPKDRRGALFFDPSNA